MCRKLIKDQIATVYQTNQLWQTLPSEIKDCLSLQPFKNDIKTWRCDRYQRI